MSTERGIGLVMLVVGLATALWLVPSQTVTVEAADLQPALFPTFAAWAIALCGLVRALGLGERATAQPHSAVRDDGGVRAAGHPPVWLAFVLLAAGAAVVLAGFAWLGFVAAAPAMMLALMLYAREDRRLWLAIGTLGVPALIWVVFELWLGRPLP